jgi:hypothetical protein
VFAFPDEQQLLLDRLGGRQFLQQCNVRMVNVNSAEDDISVWDLSNDTQSNDQPNTDDNWLNIMLSTSNIKWKQMTARKWTHEGRGKYSLVDQGHLSIQQQVKEVVNALDSDDKTGIVKTMLVICLHGTYMYLFAIFVCCQLPI